MLFSAPLEVARTNACTSAPSCDERLGQVRAHEAVGAGDEHGAAAVDGPNSPLSSASASSVHWVSVGGALTGADSLARPG